MSLRAWIIIILSLVALAYSPIGELRPSDVWDGIVEVWNEQFR